MAHMKSAANLRNSASGGKQAFLPPKSPFPSIPPVYADYSLNHAPGSKGIPRQRDGHRQHQRTSSESFLIEEQPSWLDDLLNEPETPVRRGAHRRSSSDSFAYLDAFHLSSNMDSPIPEDYNYRSLSPIPSWGCQEFEYCQDNQYASYFTDANSYGKVHNRGRESGLISGAFPGNGPTMRDKTSHLVSAASTSESDAVISAAPEKLEQEESSHHEPKVHSEKKEASLAKHPQPEADQKRVKQQFAQRSRVRKLQYIAELERNVQALQAEGSEVSAELQFLDQQNLILSLENKALKQRLDSLAQEQLLKRLQQEMLEREIARLRALCQQQQLQQQLPASMHSRSNSRDLDNQFANLSLKHKEANSGRDAMAGPLRI